MILTNKDIYRQILTEHNLPLFFQEWYLDCVGSGAAWTPYILADESGKNLAIWVVVTKKKMGVTIALQPQLTPYFSLLRPPR